MQNSIVTAWRGWTARDYAAPPTRQDIIPAAALIVCAALYQLTTSAALSLLLLVGLAALAWWRSGLSVALIPLAVPYYRLPKTFSLGRSWSFSLGETVIVLMVIIVLAQQLIRLADRETGVSALRLLVPPTPFLWPAALLLAAAAAATVKAHYHTVALREYREVLLEPAFFYWLVLQRLHGTRGAVMLALSLVASAGIVCAMGAWELSFRAGDLINARTIGERFVNAVYQDQNSLAMLIDRALPVALCLILWPQWLGALRAVPGGLEEAAAARWVQGALLACVALMTAVLYRTGSRGGEATVALCLLIMLLYWQQRHRLLPILSVGILAVAAFIARHRLASFLDGSHGLSNGAHQSVWRSALRMIRDHRLFGVGPDNFLYYYSNDNACAPGHIANYYYRQDKQTNFERCLSHPHNMVLDFWLSTGFLGVVAALILLALFAVLGLAALRKADSLTRGPLLGALLAMLALVAHGEVDNSYFLPDMAVIFWLCLGIVTLCRQAKSSC